MQITEDKREQVTILMVEGRIDSITSGTLEKKILEVMSSGEKNMVINFAGVDYISSAGLRVLLMAAKKSSARGGKLVLAVLGANVQEVFDIAGFIGIFTIVPSQEEAVQLF